MKGGCSSRRNLAVIASLRRLFADDFFQPESLCHPFQFRGGTGVEFADEPQDWQA